MSLRPIILLFAFLAVAVTSVCVVAQLGRNRPSLFLKPVSNIEIGPDGPRYLDARGNEVSGWQERTTPLYAPILAAKLPTERAFRGEILTSDRTGIRVVLLSCHEQLHWGCTLHVLDGFTAAPEMIVPLPISENVEGSPERLQRGDSSAAARFIVRDLQLVNLDDDAELEIAVATSTSEDFASQFVALDLETQSVIGEFWTSGNGTFEFTNSQGEMQPLQVRVNGAELFPVSGPDAAYPDTEDHPFEALIAEPVAPAEGLEENTVGSP